MEKHKVLDQLLEELQHFLKLLDGEHLSGTAAVRKGLLAELLQAYKSSNGGDEEYIYMNKVIVTGQNHDKTDREHRAEAEANGRAAKPIFAPQKSLPELPLPRTGLIAREPFPLPPTPTTERLDAQESYYEEAQPYDSTINDEAEAVSSSYESYDDDEISTKKSTAQHQWPSTEASIELMRDARICAFLWRKKWLGQWAKQLCVIRENRLLCYKSSKEQTPLLDVSLMGCSVVYKEKQLKRKEHKLKIVPQGGETIVLSLQSREQAEQWLKVIQEISPKSADGSDVGDSPRLICTKGEISERYSMASESGSSTDSHAEILEKDVKKKYGAGLKLSNLMNIGKKKISSLDSPEKNMETSGYLNVLVKSQWRMRWCLIKNGQLWFYQDKGRSKQAQQPVQLEGCMVLPDPSPDHLYSFRIQMDGEELAILEAKSSADMGHWLGLLLSQTGTKTDPEDLTYDYVNSERISSIVNAAKTSMYLMQRRYSEPNAYIDNLPLDNQGSEDIYDDVASIENEQEDGPDGGCERGVTMERDGKERVHLDLMPVRSFLHTNAGMVSPQREPSPTTTPTDEHQHPGNEPVRPAEPEYETSLPASAEHLNPPPVTARPDLDTAPRPHAQLQRVQLPVQESQKHSSTPSTVAPRGQIQTQSHTSSQTPHSPLVSRGRAASTDRLHERSKLCAAGSGPTVVKLGKNRTEADVRRFTDERDRLEREREEVKNTLATLRKERREAKEDLSSCQEPSKQPSLEAYLKQKEEECREAEQRRVEVELSLVEVKESLKKVEAGPFTLGTTVDSGLLDCPMPKPLPSPAAAPAAPAAPVAPVNNGDSSPVNSTTALKSRPLSIMAASKGNVLQKAKEWEKKSST
ncbi:actin filament-associated protein 1-like 2 isoform X2 [Electrophorus electricus]|uniref:actin filament-associated protein 1-like 2 isoform X2 n=1 Tax=Electrophorus electricus TaxID=8005 RepID=UPI0015D02D48|nr:actin filament-associated protein 1-like 2 isoform X2 [Electrophorus electricus]